MDNMNGLELASLIAIHNVNHGAQVFLLGKFPDQEEDLPNETNKLSRVRTIDPSAGVETIFQTIDEQTKGGKESAVGHDERFVRGLISFVACFFQLSGFETEPMNVSAEADSHGSRRKIHCLLTVFESNHFGSLRLSLQSSFLEYLFSRVYQVEQRKLNHSALSLFFQGILSSLSQQLKASLGEAGYRVELGIPDVQFDDGKSLRHRVYGKMYKKELLLQGYSGMVELCLQKQSFS